VGNCWPVFLRFKGGKGVATALGAFLALTPAAIPVAAIVWAIVVAAFRYVSLASILASLSLAIGAWILGYPSTYAATAACAAALILWRHHENVRRLLSGTERRLGERASAT
jgi:glycerol-3-phosphate acyltransferase PlsY